MCGPVRVNLSGFEASDLARAQARGRSSVPPADGAIDDARRAGAEAHARLLAERLDLGEGELRADPRHRLDEILDHAVGLGVINVEAVELAVADEVDAGPLLRREDDARGVDHRLLARAGGKPVGDRIGTDDGGQDAGRRHGGFFQLGRT